MWAGSEVAQEKNIIQIETHRSSTNIATRVAPANFGMTLEQ